MTSTSFIDCKKFRNLQVRGIDSATRIALPTSYSREFIPVQRSHIPTPDTAKKWSHLQHLEKDIVPTQSCEVGLLIGYDCPQALAPMEFVHGVGDQPFAQKTELGWSIVGRTQCYEESCDQIGTTNRIITMEVRDELKLHVAEKDTPNEVHYVCRTDIKEEIIPQVTKMLESDFPERKLEDTTMSQDDLTFMNVIGHGIHQREDGFYEMLLPFRKQKPDLPSNKYAVSKRLDMLKRRLRLNPNLHADYRVFMNDIIEHGEAEAIPEDEVEPKHVYHPKKPEKLRVVFDCSAKYKGTCLNDHLLQGPDLINSLIGVLCRFREGPIAIIGDIERMFHQFRVNEEDRDYLRFLWWKNGNIDVEPSVYRMKVHLFGSTSSPGCANYGLKKIASDYKECYSMISMLITD